MQRSVLLTLSAAFCLLLAFPFEAGALSRDIPLIQISDDSQARKSLAPVLFSGDRSKLALTRKSLKKLPTGEFLEVSTQTEGGGLVVSLSRKKDGKFSFCNQGSWQFFLAASNGSVDRMVFYPRTDENCYLEYTPEGTEGERTRVSAIIYGTAVTWRSVLAFPFKDLLITSLSDVLAHTGKNVPLRYFEPKVADYRDIRALTAKIRSYLPRLTFLDDGALDENGTQVLIASGDETLTDDEKIGLNCSGMVKWIADGLLRSSGRERLTIQELLKEPPDPSGETEVPPGQPAEVERETRSSLGRFWDESRQPWFGLDWVRNAALALTGDGEGATGNDEDVEIRSAPFCLYAPTLGETGISRAGPFRSAPDYLKGTGFEVEGLKALLYSLAIDQTNSFFFFSMSRRQGTDVILRQHYHVGAFLPQFSGDGTFEVPVFESAVESDLDSFIARHRGELVYLVRVPVQTRFTP